MVLKEVDPHFIVHCSTIQASLLGFPFLILQFTSAPSKCSQWPESSAIVHLLQGSREEPDISSPNDPGQRLLSAHFLICLWPTGMCVCYLKKIIKPLPTSCREMESINEGREKCCTCWWSNSTLTTSAQEQVAWVRVCNFRKIQNWSEFTTSTKNSSTYCGAALKYKSLLLSMWLGVLFFVHFSNLTGLQGSTLESCMLLLSHLLLCALAEVEEWQKSVNEERNTWSKTGPYYTQM